MKKVCSEFRSMLLQRVSLFCPTFSSFIQLINCPRLNINWQFCNCTQNTNFVDIAKLCLFEHFFPLICFACKYCRLVFLCIWGRSSTFSLCIDSANGFRSDVHEFLLSVVTAVLARLNRMHTDPERSEVFVLQHLLIFCDRDKVNFLFVFYLNQFYLHKSFWEFSRFNTTICTPQYTT